MSGWEGRLTELVYMAIDDQWTLGWRAAPLNIKTELAKNNNFIHQIHQLGWWLTVNSKLLYLAILNNQHKSSSCEWSYRKCSGFKLCSGYQVGANKGTLNGWSIMETITLKSTVGSLRFLCISKNRIVNHKPAFISNIYIFPSCLLQDQNWWSICSDFFYQCHWQRIIFRQHHN